MPRTSQKAKTSSTAKTRTRSVKSETSKTEKTEQLAGSTPFLNQRVSLRRRPSKAFFIIIIIIGLLVLFYFKKGWFVAATVDGKPITNIELQTELNKTYRSKALDKLVSDKIINQIESEAAAKGVTVSQQEVDQQLAKDEAQYGGQQSFESLLSQQGISKDDYIKYDIKIKLLAERLYQKESTPTDAEIQTAMDANKDAPEATEPAKFKQMVTDGLTSQKASDLLNKRFQELKSKVVTY